MSKSKKKAEALPAARWVGEAEAAAYERLFDRFSQAGRVGEQRLVGGIELLPPAQIDELHGDFRPGLVAFASEAAGDYLAWDRRLPGEQGTPVVYVDHEEGTATPYAKNVIGAFNHTLLQALAGIPGAQAAAEITAWLHDFAEFLDPDVEQSLRKLREKGQRAPKRPALANTEAAHHAAAHLIDPRAQGGLATIPLTYVPLLAPQDPECLDSAADCYKESIATFRVMVEVEGRPAFRWYLAAALRGLADVLIRRERFAEAGKAAWEAVELYEPLLESGDARVTTGLAFVHRVVAVAEFKKKKLASAFEHAERALSLNESALFDACVVLNALDQAATGWEAERAGAKAHDVQLHLNVAVKQTEAFRNAEPPHPYRPQAERIARLAMGKAPKRR